MVVCTFTNQIVPFIGLVSKPPHEGQTAANGADMAVREPALGSVHVRRSSHRSRLWASWPAGRYVLEQGGSSCRRGRNGAHFDALLPEPGTAVSPASHDSPPDGRARRLS